MKKFIGITVVLLLIAQHTKAQYSKMVLGTRCPFDTAVAIQIKTYRMESEKFRLGDSLIQNLRKMLLNSDSLRIFETKRNTANLAILSLKEEEIKAKEVTILRLKNEMQYKPQPTWWDRNKNFIIFASGFISGGAVIHFIKK